jgi:hypothetical protein
MAAAATVTIEQAIKTTSGKGAGRSAIKKHKILKKATGEDAG